MKCLPDHLQCLDIPVSSVGPKARVDFSPLDEVILASKLSAIACTSHISDDWIPVNCLLFDADTAADAINRNCSATDIKIMKLLHKAFLPRVTPSPN